MVFTLWLRAVFLDGQILTIDKSNCIWLNCLISVVLSKGFMSYVLSKLPRDVYILYIIYYYLRQLSCDVCTMFFVFLFWNSTPQTSSRSGRGTEDLPRGRPHLQPKEKNRSVGLSQNLAWIQEKNFEERFEVVKVIGWAKMSEHIVWEKIISVCMWEMGSSRISLKEIHRLKYETLGKCFVQRSGTWY